MDNPRYNLEIIVLLYSFCCWIIFPSVSMSPGVYYIDMELTKVMLARVSILQGYAM